MPQNIHKRLSQLEAEKLTLSRRIEATTTEILILKRRIDIPTVDGHSVDNDDMHWTVNCPACGCEIEYTGYFDSSDTNKCKCGNKFKTKRVYFEDGSYML